MAVKKHLVDKHLVIATPYLRALSGHALSGAAPDIKEVDVEGDD